jgi:hypothetical protein
MGARYDRIYCLFRRSGSIAVSGDNTLTFTGGADSFAGALTGAGAVKITASTVHLRGRDLVRR